VTAFLWRNWVWIALAGWILLLLVFGAAAGL